MSPKKRFKLLKSMGYIPHPGLPGGRATWPDGSTEILFIKRDHPMAALRDPEAIRVAYLVAQHGDEPPRGSA